MNRPSHLLNALEIQVSSANFGAVSFTSSETLAKTQTRLHLWLNMSQTFVEKHNYDKRATFKIYRSFVFGQANCQWSAWGTGTLASKSKFLKQ